ncbi:MAG TPA: hypothetical protein VEW66_08155 [Thermomicrobiales bacterium]|nr:hypothetical protein [Thermomicrobiales bacterium]
MSRSLVALLGLVLALVFAGPAVSAQDAADLEAIAEVVLATDQADLVAALEEPITDSDLPGGFLAPVDGVPENADIIDAFVSGMGDLGGVATPVNQGLDTDPKLIPGLLSTAVITYMVTEEEITEDDLADFADGVEEGLADDPTMEGTVEQVELFDSEAVLSTLTLEQDGIFVVVQMLAIPVGSTMVVGTLLSADQTEVDSTDILPLTEDLTVAGVEYLGTAAEAAG